MSGYMAAMSRRRLAVAAALVGLAVPLGACGSDGNTGDGADDGFQSEDPTLNEESDLDTGNSGQSNQPSDNGSGTGAGRGDG